MRVSFSFILDADPDDLATHGLAFLLMDMLHLQCLFARSLREARFRAPGVVETNAVPQEGEATEADAYQPKPCLYSPHRIYFRAHRHSKLGWLH
ncbi:hypothetical protein [Candidatus Methylacidithermus pantelleriae]|uniref:Uncharacterized protein n=1 Tax=Candidatus Methylacidithermus pantelleriae TaxID=2744239 RepID=A0A8J2BSM8_9BACT|nr:hypothetical protein [Candidatus Methylacidithermus pantelleriae]CAF0695821.1 hypothetical protein MPNT_20023 [Candidatus Methylacidithermus pantelleriae]